MPRKRKAAAKDVSITVKAPEPVEIESQPTMPIRCIWDSYLIIGADKTPSRTRYEFNTDEIKQVSVVDYEYLLSLTSRTPGCCGGYGGSGSIPSVQKYFTEV